MIKITLASGSPRRKELLASLGVDFEVRTKPIDESVGDAQPPHEAAQYLARLKAQAFEKDVQPHELIITADTVVIHDHKILGKPQNKAHAQQMLLALSGNTHEVVTGVCIYYQHKYEVFAETTQVVFKSLTTQEVNYYIEHYQPFDKAGAYGIQEWIGMVGIERIEGDYYNVVGLPLQKVYTRLKAIAPEIWG
ncbi:Maf family nucleotide pyrophosphatase [Microscilla marina]|uniref:dTTP/UTP pyrophosphatase n=1 Tax=Microscilla marina ATCC 23134 TaxID=313606 RepID=A1ZE79_MICM2|nr:Maf family nucleotide pyrophosphatase [Microscilla marina]EAY31387.1 septum formation protein Maf [Microscilla marina ATCC 23134]